MFLSLRTGNIGLVVALVLMTAASIQAKKLFRLVTNGCKLGAICTSVGDLIILIARRYFARIRMRRPVVVR